MPVNSFLSSCGQRAGGEGQQRGDEVDSREQRHPPGEAQLHRCWDVQSAV